MKWNNKTTFNHFAITMNKLKKIFIKSHKVQVQFQFQVQKRAKNILSLNLLILRIKIPTIMKKEPLNNNLNNFFNCKTLTT